MHVHQSPTDDYLNYFKDFTTVNNTKKNQLSILSCGVFAENEIPELKLVNEKIQIYKFFF